MVFNAAAAIAVMFGVVYGHLPSSPLAAGGPASPAATPGVAQTRIVGQRLDVEPPAYTGLPSRHQDSLPARVPEGAILRWRLRFAPQPGSAQLVFHDGVRLPLQRQGDDWIGSRQLLKSTLYRIELGAAPALDHSGLQRIDVIADRPPQLRVIEPDRSLTVLEAKQAGWLLAFEASDDFGLGAARLRITLAQGSGEVIKVSTRSIELSGQGDQRKRSYRRQLDLAALGFAIGDDLVARLEVSDRRAPNPQTTRSSSFILRWPPEAGAQATGIEGLVKRSLSAYFRSQRQIIIDSEALLAKRGKQSGADFLKHSDEIGVDQRILRLRYGQFLGEEAEDGRKTPPATTGDADAVIQAFGDVHDQPEAATMLDPDTRNLLRSALNEMWQAELHLHLGQPDQALPFEYRALRLIKQVQQSSRIYLARVGLELPPIDETRRLGGDRAGLQNRRDALVPAQVSATPVRELWQSLDGDRPGATRTELDAFETWLRGEESQLPAALDLYADVDALRQSPDCQDCARKLRARLWPLLEHAAPVIDPRREPDRTGRAYLDALQTEPAP
jgi:hypothetical protein